MGLSRLKRRVLRGHPQSNHSIIPNSDTRIPPLPLLPRPRAAPPPVSPPGPPAQAYFAELFPQLRAMRPSEGLSDFIIDVTTTTASSLDSGNSQGDGGGSPSSPCSCCATWPCTGSCSRVRKRRHSQRSRSGRSEAAELRGPGGCIAAYACRMYVKQAIPGKSTTDTASEQREYELLSSAWQQELPTAAAAVPVPPQEGSSCQAGRQAGHPVPLGPFRPRPASRMLPLLQACGRGAPAGQGSNGANWIAPGALHANQISLWIRAGPAGGSDRFRPFYSGGCIPGQGLRC